MSRHLKTTRNIRVCMYVCVFMYACMYLCICICMCMYIYIVKWTAWLGRYCD